MSDPTNILLALKQNFSAIEFKDSAEDKIYYGQDWTRFAPPNPSAIAFPRSTTEISQLLSFCNRERIQVVPSGGRTGLSGGAVAGFGELVISLEKMKSVQPVDRSASSLRVEAGVNTKTVQEMAAEAGLYWPVDLASSGSCHIGGNIATNAGGLHVIRYGHTRRWIQSLEVVLIDGRVLELNGNLDKNNTGYDFRNLFIGSEGTLGIISAATLKLCEAPKSLQSFLFALESLEQALEILADLRSRGLVLHTFEVFSKNCLELVKQVTSKASPFEDPKWPFYLLFEVDTLGSSETLNAVQTYVEELFLKQRLHEGFLAQSAADSRSYWFWRENITESLNTQGKVYKNDISVPVSSLPAFIKELESLTHSRFGAAQVFLFGHLGDGNIHVNLLQTKEMDSKKFVESYDDYTEHLFALVQKYRGSIAAEHGIGMIKTRHLHYSRSADEIDLMKKVKSVFDPQGLLNPGKIFTR